MKNFNTIQEYICTFYLTINRIIYNAPKTSKQIVLYRGIQTKAKNIDINNIFINHGIMSTTVNTRVAINFAFPYKHSTGYLSKIVIPQNTPCLYISIGNYKESESEIILMDTSTFKYKNYSPRNYITYIEDNTHYETLNILTNKLTLIDGLSITGLEDIIHNVLENMSKDKSLIEVKHIRLIPDVFMKRVIENIQYMLDYKYPIELVEKAFIDVYMKHLHEQDPDFHPNDVDKYLIIDEIRNILK